MFAYRVFRQGEDVLLAIADAELIGNTVGDETITIEISGEFYGTESCDAARASDLLADATIINAVGKKTIALLVSKGLVDGDRILTIGGVPHAQVVSV